MKTLILLFTAIVSLSTFGQYTWDEVYYNPYSNTKVIVNQETDQTIIIEDESATVINGDADVIIVDDSYYASPVVHNSNCFDNWFYSDWHYNRWCYNDYSLYWSSNYYCNDWRLRRNFYYSGYWGWGNYGWNAITPNYSAFILLD